MKNFALITLVLLLISCSPNNQLRRAQKLIAKAELQGGVWHSDTILVKVPVFIDRVTLDTLLVARPNDTITVIRDRLKLKFVDLPGDTVWLSGECAADTVYKEVPVTVTKVINAPRSNWWRALLIGIGIGAFAVILALIALRR